MLLNSFAEAVSDLVLSRSCGGCGRLRTPWCADCAHELAQGREQPAAEIQPRPCPVGFPRTWAQTTYDGVIASAIKAHKDGGRADLTADLAFLLRDALAECLSDPMVSMHLGQRERVSLLAVPSSPKAIRERGRPPMQELVRFVAEVPKAPWQVSAPVRVSRRVRDQSRLHAQARTTNLHGSMSLKTNAIGDVAGRVCIVADDIVTTGATLTELSRVLRAAGARDVFAIAIAATQRRSSC